MRIVAVCIEASKVVIPELRGADMLSCNESMRAKLTSKQEGYAQDRASGLSHSAAYRNNDDTSKMSAKTVWEEASRLDKHPKVSARILELQAATEAALAERRLWTTDRLVE